MKLDTNILKAVNEATTPAIHYYDIFNIFNTHLEKAWAGNFASKDFTKIMNFLKQCKEDGTEIEVIVLPPHKFLKTGGKGHIVSIEKSIVGPQIELSDGKTFTPAYFIKILKDGNKYIIIEDAP